jgi:hypothetical protein
VASDTTTQILLCYEEKGDSQCSATSGYSVDSPAGVLETTYGLVLGPFFHQLLRLYFQNIHPYYPVIDEFDFDACFAEAIEEEGLRNSRACVLGVMLLCASMVNHGLQKLLQDPRTHCSTVSQLSATLRLLKMDTAFLATVYFQGRQGSCMPPPRQCSH